MKYVIVLVRSSSLDPDLENLDFLTHLDDWEFTPYLEYAIKFDSKEEAEKIINESGYDDKGLLAITTQEAQKIENDSDILDDFDQAIRAILRSNFDPQLVKKLFKKIFDEEIVDRTMLE